MRVTTLKELLKLKEEVEAKQAEVERLEKTKARLGKELAKLKKHRQRQQQQ